MYTQYPQANIFHRLLQPTDRLTPRAHSRAPHRTHPAPRVSRPPRPCPSSSRRRRPGHLRKRLPPLLRSPRCAQCLLDRPTHHPGHQSHSPPARKHVLQLPRAHADDDRHWPSPVSRKRPLHVQRRSLPGTSRQPAAHAPYTHRAREQQRTVTANDADRARSAGSAQQSVRVHTTHPNV